MPVIWRYASMLSASLCIHIAIVAYFGGVAQIPQSGAPVGGENGMEIGLGMLGSYVETESQAEAKPDQESEPVELVEQPHETTVAETTEAPVAQVEQRSEHEPAEPVYATTNENVAPLFSAVRAPQIVEETAERPAPKTTETIESPTQPEPTTTPLAVSQTAMAMERATGQARDERTGTKVGNAKDYFALLMARLNHYKRYPKEAKKAKQQGIVELQFAFNRQGEILEKRIKTSSGHPLLDQAAMRMLDDAAPLPAPPDAIRRNRLVLVIPVDYSLITNSLFK